MSIEVVTPCSSEADVLHRWVTQRLNNSSATSSSDDLTFYTCVKCGLQVIEK